MREAARRLERAHAEYRRGDVFFASKADDERQREEKGEDWKVLEEHVVVTTTKANKDGEEEKSRSAAIDAFMITRLRDVSAIRAFFSGPNCPPLVSVKIINCKNVKRLPSGCFERCEKTLKSCGCASAAWKI